MEKDGRETLTQQSMSMRPCKFLLPNKKKMSQSRRRPAGVVTYFLPSTQSNKCSRLLHLRIPKTIGFKHQKRCTKNIYGDFNKDIYFNSSKKSHKVDPIAKTTSDRAIHRQQVSRQLWMREDGFLKWFGRTQ